MKDSKYQLMCLFNEYFGSCTYFYMNEKNIETFYEMASQNYGIETSLEEVKECFNLFVNTLLRKTY